MERIEKTVFLCYRRTNIPWALAIFQSLTHHGYDVFFDFNGISSGDFERVILGNIHARAHFLVLLTPSALERCSEPGDWLRREIDTAISSHRNIVPLMLESFDFGSPGIANQLTGTLDGLQHYNALRVHADYFEEAMSRLRDKYLNVALDTVLHPASVSAARAAQVEQAAASAAPAVTERELTAQEWYERGFKAVDLDEQIRFYSEAIRLKPDYTYAFYFRGSARTKRGDSEGALQDYTEAIRLDPSDATNFRGRGSALEEKGDLEGALQDYSEAIRIKPDDTYAVFFRGVVREKKGDLEGALQDFNEAIQFDPNDAINFRRRGSLREKTGDLDGALQDYNEAIRLEPDAAIAFYFRGGAREKKGDLEGALHDCAEAIRLEPNDAMNFRRRGNFREKMGDLEGALQDYNEAIRLEPDDPYPFYRRALIWQQGNQPSAAIEDLQQFLKLGDGIRGRLKEKAEEMIRDLRKRL
jgi:tetratricopeptide (TPR) repeat protein